LLWGEVMLLTVEGYAATEHGEDPTELVRGVVVRRQFSYVTHGLACASVCHSLGVWDRQFGFGTPIALHGVITRRNPDSLRSIDVAYYSGERLPGDEAGDEYLAVAPEAAFEVRSHDETWWDIMQKVHEFIQAGTRAFVALDPFVDTVHVFLRDAPVRILYGDDELVLPGVLPHYCWPVRDFFE